MLPELLDQIDPNQEIATVTAPLGDARIACQAVDGAFDTRKCHDAIADRGAASIPPRRNARPWKPTTAGASARNETLQASTYRGRSLWRRWSGYHRRAVLRRK